MDAVQVEMVQIVKPAESYKALEDMTGHAENILKVCAQSVLMMQIKSLFQDVPGDETALLL
jgi:seryl-tRNA synthetase